MSTAPSGVSVDAQEPQPQHELEQDPSEWPILETPDITELELFRRSPHPYHRRQHEIDRLDTPQCNTPTTSLPSSALHHAQSLTPRTISDEDGRNRRKAISQSPSESGTEADDEGYCFVKALPAPPLRPRKGLRDLRGSGLDADGLLTPLLTPSLVDEEGKRCGVNAEYFRQGRRGTSDGSAKDKDKRGAKRNGIPSGMAVLDEEARKARDKYVKRRRNEMLRRTTEVGLLCAIGALAVGGCGCWKEIRRRWPKEILTHAFVLAGALTLYPVRLMWYSRTRGYRPFSTRTLRSKIHIPAAFDPAPILYPTILPAIISISLFSQLEKVLLPNLLLGLAAMPSGLIPWGRMGSEFSSLHWLASILPLIVSEKPELLFQALRNTRPDPLLPSALPYCSKTRSLSNCLDPEILVCLFALHHALLPPLHYLTTTSLLPTELHLLSIGLINLLFFADSPQAEILKVLLWVGGVGLFVLCGKVLKWGVALARIPRWRFRRAGQIIQARQSFLQVLNGGLLPGSRNTARRASDSDADEDQPAFNTLAKAKSLKLNTSKAKARTPVSMTDDCKSAIEATWSFANPFSSDRNHANTIKGRNRRNTLPTLPSQDNITRQTPDRRRLRSKSTAQSFLALTSTQATLRKWLYAGYFYLVVILIILFPIRHLISKQALSSHEPFGWAIGYLFGNIQRLRFEILNWDLESWIPLPPLSAAPSDPLPLVEHIRLIVLGASNTRLLLIPYFASTIFLGLIAVFSLTPYFEVDTRRKVFHGIMVAMLLPTIFIDPAFIALALALVLAVFLLLDLIRASQLPPLSKPIAAFLTPYVDGRDLRGPVVVSHIFLLIGCAVPLWLSLAATLRAGEEPWDGWDVQSRDVSMVAGVVCVGMGDAAASLIGRRYGRRKWPWAGGKSLEGSAAFAAAVTVGLVSARVWLHVGWGVKFQALASPGDLLAEARGLGVRDVVSFASHGAMLVGKAAVCAMGASLNEAVLTGGNDNVVVPVVLWVLVRGVGV